MGAKRHLPLLCGRAVTTPVNSCISVEPKGFGEYCVQNEPRRMKFMQLVQALTNAQQADFCTLPGSYPITPTLPSMQQADAHWMVCNNQGQLVARCSLWWQAVPAYAHERLGL